MTKIKLFKLAGGKRQAAALLGITTQAIQKWGEDVPAMRIFQLKVLKPEWFLVKPKKEN